MCMRESYNSQDHQNRNITVRIKQKHIKNLENTHECLYIVRVGIITKALLYFFRIFYCTLIRAIWNLMSHTIFGYMVEYSICGILVCYYLCAIHLYCSHTKPDTHSSHDFVVFSHRLWCDCIDVRLKNIGLQGANVL